MATLIVLRMDIFKNKKIAGLAVGVVLLGLVYYVYSSSGSSALLTSSEEATSPLSQEILTVLGELRTITLDPALFSDPVFVSLTDFGVTIPPQQAGRRNPFAPVGAPSATPSTPSAPAGQ